MITQKGVKKQISLLQSWKKEKFYQNYFTFLVLQYNFDRLYQGQKDDFSICGAYARHRKPVFYTRHPNNNDRWTIPMT